MKDPVIGFAPEPCPDPVTFKHIPHGKLEPYWLVFNATYF